MTGSAPIDSVRSPPFAPSEHGARASVRRHSSRPQLGPFWLHRQLYADAFHRDSPPNQFKAIAEVHARTCADTFPAEPSSDAILDALVEVMAALATHIAFSDLVGDPELRQLYTAVLGNGLEARNHHSIQSDDHESFPPALNLAQTHGNQRPLQVWSRGHHARQPDLRLFAEIIGAMTDDETYGE